MGTWICRKHKSKIKVVIHLGKKIYQELEIKIQRIKQ
jgi:hypothetical protein